MSSAENRKARGSTAEKSGPPTEVQLVNGVIDESTLKPIFTRFVATLWLYPHRPLLNDTGLILRCRSRASRKTAIFLCWRSCDRLESIVFRLLSGSSNGGVFHGWHCAPISQCPSSSNARRIAAAVVSVTTG